MTGLSGLLGSGPTRARPAGRAPVERAVVSAVGAVVVSAVGAVVPLAEAGTFPGTAVTDGSGAPSGLRRVRGSRE
ncbi:hypothetical protein ACWEFL_24065 [Streptomyces sp. NPDC004838]